MVDQRIEDITGGALAALADDDKFVVLDKSDTADDPVGTVKYAIESTIASYTRTMLQSIRCMPPDGWITANNGTDAAYDIDFGAGVCIGTDGSGNYREMKLAATLTKQIDAAWSVGTNAGGLDTGSVANDTWYHLWAIMRSDTGVVDALFSLSATAPSMPANYDYRRRIGAVRYGTATILGYTQIGDVFLWDNVAVVQANNPGTGAVLVTLQVPTGIKVGAMLDGTSYGASTTGFVGYVSSPDAVDETPARGIGQLFYYTVLGAVRVYSPIGTIMTNTSGQVRRRINASSASVDIDLGCKGWVDPR